MFRTSGSLRVLLLSLVVLLLACSHTPRMDENLETDYIRMLRAEFFKSYPDGEYNEYIARGEIVAGMDFLEVVASWGNPQKRLKLSDNVEYWTYVEVDADSKDAFEYKFVFKKNILDSWELSRQIADGGLLPLPGENTRGVLVKGERVTGGSKKKHIE